MYEKNQKKSQDSAQHNENIEGYVFHILNDNISKASKDRIQILQNTLSAIYPCQIKIHHIHEKVFDGMPKWGFEQEKNYLAYYRLQLCSILPEGVQKCLYLDVDMLVMCDVRELFALDLGEFVVASNSGYPQDSNATHHLASIHGKENYQFGRYYYFCSGFMLINIPLYKAQNIESKALNFLKNYIPLYADQDALNAVIQGKIMILPPHYAPLILQMALAKGKEKRAYIAIKDSIKIAHLNGWAKPWQNRFVYRGHNMNFLREVPFHSLWWNIAAKTPAFHEELMSMRKNLFSMKQQIYFYVRVFFKEIKMLVKKKFTRF